MNEELPDLTPAETERVRRLLADAKHTDPVPADVAARLDRTLATLSEERESQKVVTLASRRRRRVTQLLVAAAAAVVVGIGVGQVVSGTGSGSDMSTSADDSADGGAGQAAEAPAEESQTDSPSAESDAGADSGGDSSYERNSAKAALAALPRVDDATFDADAAAARALPGNTDTTSAPDADDPNAVFGGTCDRPAWGEGERVLVRYQGTAAALVFRPAADGSQVVDLFACDADDVLRSGVLAAP